MPGGSCDQGLRGSKYDPGSPGVVNKRREANVMRSRQFCLPGSKCDPESPVLLTSAGYQM